MLVVYLYLAGMVSFGTFAAMMKQSDFGEANHMPGWVTAVCVAAWPVAMPIVACFLLFLQNAER